MSIADDCADAVYAEMVPALDFCGLTTQPQFSALGSLSPERR